MKKNWIISSSVLAILLIWLVSGVFIDRDSNVTEQATPELISDFQVQVEPLSAESVEQTVTFSAKTQADRRVTLRSELDARIVKTFAKRGSTLKAGDPILELDERDLPYKLNQAIALLEQRQLEYQASLDLRKKDLASDANLAASKSAVEQAKANLQAIRIDIANVELTAPFNGILQERHVEIGDYVSKGDPLATYIEADPMVAKGQVTEKQISLLKAGMPGAAVFNNNETLEGFLKYVSSESDPQSRTFNVELKVRNLENLKALGQTVNVTIPTGTAMAHKISPAHLSLNDSGELGVKYLDNKSNVQFHKAEIIKSSDQFVWISGLPENTRLITFGQGFVQEGQHVKAAFIKKQ